MSVAPDPGRKTSELTARALEAGDKVIVATAAGDNVAATLGDDFEALQTADARTDNPHAVTKAQVGLGSVDNTSDLDKPIGTLTQTALDALATTDESTLASVGALNTTNVAALASLTVANGGTVITQGYYAASDGGANVYRYDSGSSATIDGGFVIDGPGSVGRFLAVDQTTANARQFGAKGDGVTDDTAALQAAADTGSLYIPAGNYLTGEIQVASTKVYGEGTIIKDDSSFQALHLLGDGTVVDGVSFQPQATTAMPHADIKIGDGATNTTIRSCNFYSPIGSTSYSAVVAANDPAVAGGDFPYTTNASRVKIENNNFRGYTRPILLHCIEGFAIDSNVIADTEFDAIRVRELAGDGAIRNNQFLNIGDPSAVDGQTRDAIDTAWSGKNLIISGNFVKGVMRAGFDIKGASTSGAGPGLGSSNITIVGNHIEDCLYAGVAIGQTDEHSFLIADNHILRCNRANATGAGDAAEGGVRIKGAVKNVSISGNHLLYNYGRGINLENGDGYNENVSVTGNICVNNTYAGIYVGGTTGGIVSRNICTNDSALANPDAQLFGLVIRGASGDGNTVLIESNILRGNTIRPITWSGTGFQQDNIHTFRGNYEEGPGAYGSGTTFERFTAREPRIRWTAGSLPSADAGTFNVGDVIYRTTPTAGGTMGWVCVAAGAPGTWKTFGAIEA